MQTPTATTSTIASADSGTTDDVLASTAASPVVGRNRRWFPASSMTSSTPTDDDGSAEGDVGAGITWFSNHFRRAVTSSTTAAAAAAADVEIGDDYRALPKVMTSSISASTALWSLGNDSAAAAATDSSTALFDLQYLHRKCDFNRTAATSGIVDRMLELATICASGYDDDDLSTWPPTTGRSTAATGSAVDDDDGAAALPVVIIVGTLVSIVIVAIVVGNAFVVASVTVFREMRTLTNWMIVSLASADILVAVAVLPLSAYQVGRAGQAGPGGSKSNE